MFYKHLYKLPQKGQVLLNVIRKNIVIFECVNIMQFYSLPKDIWVKGTLKCIGCCMFFSTTCTFLPRVKLDGKE